ncbi:MAG: DNA topoisomerase 3 [Porphyromonas sp.]|uniref:DNA topoisomerase 3 n=1 Tax=Porphyromonas sp. TaxID=1924944 RepID=UPI002A74F203|nr:DNA topoisomerase 3 [Porphyromonas sp.]MDD6928186.1 DNA topoisomerase 3 [Bacteroidales bacterium]MDY3111150.1 DNA topoisomerase 3 [Porphyromonas sp.]
MIVCIAEKPSVARDIAKILGATTARSGYIEGNGYAVTWTYGHLCTLKEPEDYQTSWQGWRLASLPMIPERFGIKLIKEEHIERQFAIIQGLVSQAERVINCGDAGQEGELIQRWVLQLAGCTCPVERLWISSLTDQSIREGFANLRPSKELDTLYYAGLARAIGDWLLGINGTRLYTLTDRYGGRQRGVRSVGRVQTPTLALVVDRQAEIESFVPVTTYEMQTTYRGTFFRADTTQEVEVTFAERQQVEELIERIGKEPLVVQAVEQKKSTEYPPRLFDLTSLQVEANKKFGYTAEQTLRLIQSLYEKKVTTYPRVDTTFLPEDQYPKVGETLQGIARHAALGGFIAPLLSSGKPLKKSKKVFDNKKITDHHAIIPTGQLSSGLTPDEEQIYLLVALRYIAAFYPDAKVSTTTVRATVEEYPLRASGKTILVEGWREVLKPDSGKEGDDTTEGGKDKEKDKEQTLPPFKEGESGPHEPSIRESTSTPPRYYTEATLLRAMETAGKGVEDEELRDALKMNGIGRPSTRAAIIETLFKRGYIVREGKSLRATPAGIQLIESIQDPLLKSAELTGRWELKLRQIESREYDPGQFLNELKAQVSTLVSEVRGF